jgi:hypothetical protein
MSVLTNGRAGMKIQWDEPVEFFRDYLVATGRAPSRRRRAWIAVLAALAVAALILAFEVVFWVLLKKDPEVPRYTYIVGPALTALFMYFLPTMVTASRCTIVLTEQGIHRNKAMGTHMSLEFWPWDSISELAIEDMQVGTATHRVLVVCGSLQQGDILLGLGNTPLDPIEQTATQMGKPLHIRV